VSCRLLNEDSEGLQDSACTSSQSPPQIGKNE
jgi:hypothetical protein